jgi:hypothetical protein
VIVLVPWLLVRIVVMDEKGLRLVVVCVCSDNDVSTNNSSFDANRQLLKDISTCLQKLYHICSLHSSQ